MPAGQKFKSFMEDTLTPIEVDGVTLKFRAPSVRVTFLLRSQVATIAKAFDTLGKKPEDTTFKSEDITAPDSARISRTTSEPPSPETIRFRQTQRDRMIDELSKQLLDKEAMETYGTIILDCLRSDLTTARSAGLNVDSPQQLIDKSGPDGSSLPMPLFLGLMRGVMRASSGVFGPLEGKIAEVMRTVGGQVAATVASKGSAPSPATPSENSTFDGETSKTTSSSAPATDSSLISSST